MDQIGLQVKFTYEDYKLLPEEKHCELIGGEFRMTPAPGTYHQEILGRLYRLLDDHVRPHELGKLYLAPVDVILSPEDVVQPDLLFIARLRLGMVMAEGVHGSPDLVIEILSPSSAERDRLLKKKLYTKYGVREYWLVDPSSQTLEVLTLGKQGYQQKALYLAGQVLESPLLPGLKIHVSEVF